MEYSQIILEMLERIKVLENKVKVLEENSTNMQVSKTDVNVRLDNVSAKYRPLAEYLLSLNETRITLSYYQIEKILGFTLPNTANKYKQSFWANTETHSYASSWLAIGYKTRVNVDNDTVTFVKNFV